MTGKLRKPQSIVFLATMALFVAALANAEASSLVQPNSQMSDAKTLLVDDQYSQAIEIYRRILTRPDSGDHATALEYMGVAHERLGQYAKAQATYEDHLSRFATGAGTERVQQRLNALLSRNSPQAMEPRPANEMRRWRFQGGVMQDYLRDSNKWNEDAEAVVSQSALLTLGDLSVERRGARFDMGVRINAGYQKDWLDKSVGPGDQGLVSNAHLEVRDQLLDWGARLGRQSLQRDGVLGRFDGLRADYRWRPRVTFNVTAGLPVDSPRYAADTNRQFVAASVDIEGFAGWDFNAYTYQQKNDGLWDRQAIGGEVQYQNQRVNLMGTVDYDVSYGALNSALLIGNWRLHERFEVTGRANLHALPFLTSRNALIGQPVSTIDLLLDTYSAAQIRTIARNRTTDAQNASLGLAITLSERWYFNGDAGYSAIDETIASAGVEGLAASGPQLYYSARLIGSSVFRNGDTTIVGFRLGSTERADTSTLSLDLRLPFGRSFRLSPRLAVSWRDASPQGEQQLIAEPSVRLVYQARRRYRLEVEAGGRWSARDLPDALLLSPLYPDEREESLGYYFNLRWGVDF